MKKTVLIITSLLFLFNSCSKIVGNEGKEILEFPRDYTVPIVEDEMFETRAVWFSYLDYEKTLSNLSENDFKASVEV
jgi:hypothetical protein